MLRRATMTVCLALLAGCAGERAALPSQEPSLADANLESSPATRPSDVEVHAATFDALWDAGDAVARSLLFKPELEDRRAGLYQTEPMLSAQWFEPWRRDVRTVGGVVQSSLATIRRTLSIQIDRDPSGGFVARPHVLIERYSLSERRVTNSASYRSVFRARTRRTPGTGTPETDAGLNLPDSFWYPVGNDPVLEQAVAEKMADRLGTSSVATAQR